MIDDPNQISQLRREEIRRARSLTLHQRMALTFDMFDLACQTMEAGIRSQHPAASRSEIDAILRDRLARSRRWKTPG